MARGSEQATQAATTAQTNSDRLTGNSSNVYSSLFPQLEAEATAPQGFGPTDMAHMDTELQQQSGGSNAGVVGQGGLLAARMRNKGAPMAAIAEGVRESGQKLGQNKLALQNKNAELKTKQQQAGIGGLSDLYGTDLSGSTASLGQVAPNVQADVAKRKSSWDWANAILAPIVGAAGQSKYVTG